MKTFIRRLMKFVAYGAAAVVILLAIAVGLFRLFLPRLPEYQEEIKTWASAAIGYEVEFAGMNARWGLSGPELKFYDAELIRPSNQSSVLTAEEVGVGVSLMRLLADRTLVVDTVTVRNTSIEFSESGDGHWLVQGTVIDEFFPAENETIKGVGSIEIVGEDIQLTLIRAGNEKVTFFEIPALVAQRDNHGISVDADIHLPPEIGAEVKLSAVKRQGEGSQDAPWNITIEADEVSLPGLSILQLDTKRRFGSGRGAVDLSMAIEANKVVSASADLDFEAVALNTGSPFDISGRLAFTGSADGWLFAADDLHLTTPAGAWPRTSLRLETSTDDDHEVVMFDARASYLNLSDLQLLTPWLKDQHQQWLNQSLPNGVTQNMVATVSDLDTDSPRFTITADLDNIGFAASGTRPGVRGFSGTLRADSDGGLVDINTTDMTLDHAEWLTAPLDINAADGTVIWRYSNQRLTILSDNIVIESPVLQSQSNIEIIIDGDESPVIDLASSWNIDDLSLAKRYIPKKLMNPRLHQWFQDALVNGRIPLGTTQFTGQIEKFPFDGDEGELLIQANVRDMTFQYLPQFPAANVSGMDVVLENTRLYTNKNRSVNQGNVVVDAKVDIADLRKPVLKIDAQSTGTLETIRDFSDNSPVGKIFGGHLDRVSVSGDAAFTLDLTVPLLDWRSFEFTTHINSDNGTLKINGLPPPITELSGSVTVERDSVSSESLAGRFMGEPVTIELQNAPTDMPEYRVIAKASGSATPTGLVDELGVPLQGRLQGKTGYTAQVLFPQAAADVPAPLTVQFESDLSGLAIGLPAPLEKAAAEERPISGDIQFIGGERIRSRGSAAGEFAWQLDIVKTDDAWDFDRGMVTFGTATLTEPDVRGLHIRGVTGEVRLDDWLALSRGDSTKSGAAERIRSIDVEIADLHLLGQHLEDHKVRVDRSARDWLVQFDGPHVSGSVFVPYEFTADRTLVLDMERLVLPGDDEDRTADDDAVHVDPRNLPSISLHTAEFALGDRFFGAVDAEFERTAAGLLADTIIAIDPSFEIVANGSWVVDVSDPSGYRSSITATLKSTDVATTMSRLNYQPGIVSKEMDMSLDLSWSGGARLDFLDSLDGEVAVGLGAGQLDEVDPGAGRMFGLVSIVALPRRLSLDFRDVFQKGFGFDKIGGTFRIEDGDAYTCNLSLEGPAADIGIFGRAGLAQRDYEQTAVVSAKVGNTLPVAGLVIGGPQVAAALLIFSQIFRKPLEDIGQVFYSVSGSWDDPLIEVANAEQFTASGRLAGCLKETE